MTLRDNPFASYAASAEAETRRRLRTTLGWPSNLVEDTDYLARPDSELGKGWRSAFERSSWSVGSAIWMLAAGRILQGDRSAAAADMRLVLKAAPALCSSEQRLPPSVQKWIKSFRSAPPAHWTCICRLRMHDWLRWAHQKRLPVSPRFWSAYYIWKSTEWPRGLEVAMPRLDATEGPRISYATAAEYTWHISFKFDEELSRHYGSEFFWEYSWASSQSLVLDAIESVDTAGEGGRPKTAEELSRRRRAVGTALYSKISDAVDVLARQTHRNRLSSGKFDFPYSRQELITALKQIDPKLSFVGDTSFHHALPAFASYRRPGRPARRIPETA